MAKQLKDILAGVKSSVTRPGSTGSIPGVDYDPKSTGDQKFVAQHDTEVHADRVGNGDDVYKGTTKPVLDDSKEKRHGRNEKESVDTYKKTNEEVEELDEIGDTSKGQEALKATKQRAQDDVDLMNAHVKKHGMDMSTAKHDEMTKKREKRLKDRDSASKRIKEDIEQIDEIGDTTAGQKTIKNYIKKAGGGTTNSAVAHQSMASDAAPGGSLHKTSVRKTKNRVKGVERAVDRLKEETIDEVITKKTSSAEVIRDFVKSKNPKFASKSKEERTKMALGAYYSMHPEKSKKIDEAKKKCTKETTGSDTPVKYAKTSADDVPQNI